MKDPMDIGLPDKLSLEKFPTYIRITRKWFGIQTIFITVFAVFWNGLLYSYYGALHEEADSFDRLFPLIHVGAGIFMTYYAIASWFNTSTVSVSKQIIEIIHKPIPWFGNKSISSMDLKQLYVKERVTRQNNGNNITYEVHAILYSGTNAKLLTGLETSEQALYIEQEIEKYLGIKNARVKGEIDEKTIRL